MKPNAPSSGINRRALLSALACFQPCPHRSFPSPHRRRRRRRAACCRRGTTGRRSRRSSTSCAPPPTGRAPTTCPGGPHRHVRPGRHALGRASDVHAGDLLPGPRARVVAKKPELKNIEPFKTVLSGNREAIAKLSMHDLDKILAATLTGMSVEEFNAEAKKWIETAKHPRWNRPYTELIYQPMLEVLRYLRDNGYKTYIVTGGGQDFVRVYAEKVYGIPPEQVIGTAGGTKYGYAKRRQAVPDQGAEAAAQRQQRRQARRHPPDDRPSALRGVRQLDRRPADAGMTGGRRRRAAEDAGAARRRQARIRLRPGPRPARHQGRHFHAGALRRGEEGRLDGDQHEERLEAHLCVRIVPSSKRTG